MLLDSKVSISEIAIIVLNDVRYYLSVIEPTVFQASLPVLSGSTIGQHTRHIIEFYNCLIGQSNSGKYPVINYAKRERDYLIESQPEHALRNINDICQQLADLDISKKCQLNCEEHSLEELMIDSTIGRELIYNIEHTIHHLAIIKIGLRTSIPALELPVHFGVAPSTLRHRQEACAQ